MKIAIIELTEQNSMQNCSVWLLKLCFTYLLEQKNMFYRVFRTKCECSSNYMWLWTRSAYVFLSVDSMVFCRVNYFWKLFQNIYQIIWLLIELLLSLHIISQTRVILVSSIEICYRTDKGGIICCPCLWSIVAYFLCRKWNSLIKRYFTHRKNAVWNPILQ